MMFLRFIRAKGGFTLIELLVVISIISLLSSIVFSSLSASRVKARDARRALEVRSIYLALQSYYQLYGCLPKTSGSTCNGASGYSESNAGGWDYSSQGGFLTFLVSSGITPVVPVDPINTMTGDSSPAGTYAYRYYCYLSGGANVGLHLGYYSERTNTEVVVNRNGFADPDFVCQ